MPIILNIVIWFLVLVQGGFFEKSFLIATGILVIALLVECFRKNVKEVILLLARGKLFIFLELGICICYIISICYHRTEIANYIRIEYMIFILVFTAYLLLASDVEKLYYSIVALGIVQSCIALLSYLGFSLPYVIVNARYMGTFQYANATGLFMGIVLLVQWGMLQRKNVFCWARILMLVTLIFTFSAGAIGCYVVTLMLAEISVGYKKEKNIISKALLKDIAEITISVILAVCTYYAKFNLKNTVLTCLLIALIVMVSVYFPKISLVFQKWNIKNIIIFLILSIGIAGILSIYFFGKRVAGTGMERLQQMQDAVIVLKDNPIYGLGVGNWQNYISNHHQIKYKVSLVHNSYLQLGIEAGIFVMLFFVCIIFSWYYKVLRKKSDIEIWQTAVMTMTVIHFTADITFFFGGIVATVLVCIYPNLLNNSTTLQLF